MTMTSEQMKQWQKAIALLDYSDFYALTQAGLQESAERFARRNVPLWIVQLREHLIAPGWAERQTWVPAFALRSEVAMVGLSLVYPNLAGSPLAWQRTLLGFLQQALQPLVEWVESDAPQTPPASWVDDSRDQRRRDYDPLVQIYRLGSADPLSLDTQHWEIVRQDIYLYQDYATSPHSKGALSLAAACIRLAQTILSGSENQFHSSLVSKLIAQLTRQYQWCPASRERNATEQVALAYLAALEAECPPPDWVFPPCP